MSQSAHTLVRLSMVVMLVSLCVGAFAHATPLPDAQQIRATAEQGDIEAQARLADLYATGQGVRRNLTSAADWYRKAAEQGHAGAQYTLGDFHIWGSGVKLDRAEAEHWYRRAAEQLLPAAERGDIDAQARIARLYDLGRGVPVDPSASARWYREAAERGHAEAQYQLGRMLKMGRGIEASRGEAKRWLNAAAAQGHADAAGMLQEMSPGAQAKAALKGLLDSLAFPFVFYLFWGPFAFHYLTRAAIRRQLPKHPRPRIALRTGVAMALLFAPALVTSEGGNIPVLFPYWLALLYDVVDPRSVDLQLFHLTMAVPLAAIIFWRVAAMSQTVEAHSNRAAPDDRTK